MHTHTQTQTRARASEKRVCGGHKQASTHQYVHIELTHAQYFAKRLKQKTLIPFAMAN